MGKLARANALERMKRFSTRVRTEDGLGRECLICKTQMFGGTARQEARDWSEHIAMHLRDGVKSWEEYVAHVARLEAEHDDALLGTIEKLLVK